MNMIEATCDDAEIVGAVHSLAWRKAYEDIFPTEYIVTDTPVKRKQEFRNKGLGTETIKRLKEIYMDYRMVLWTLEINTLARNFYEKNGFVITANKRIINRGKEFVQVQYEFKN